MSKGKDDERAARLAEALRANLRRRKDQQRQQGAREPHESGGGDSPSPPQSPNESGGGDSPSPPPSGVD